MKKKPVQCSLGEAFVPPGPTEAAEGVQLIAGSTKARADSSLHDVGDRRGTAGITRAIGDAAADFRALVLPASSARVRVQSVRVHGFQLRPLYHHYRVFRTINRETTVHRTESVDIDAGGRRSAPAASGGPGSAEKNMSHSAGRRNRSVDQPYRMKYGG